jgi:hypothetical protein
MIAKARRPWCGLCYGRGYRRVGAEYQPCSCGRLPNSDGARKIAEQETLKERLRSVKVKGW